MPRGVFKTPPLNDERRVNAADGAEPSLSRDGYSVVNRPKPSPFGERPELIPLAEPTFDGPRFLQFDDR